MVVIKNGQLKMYDITEEYKNYLRKYDCRVSQKEKRKFYGIIVKNNNVDYYIPFTSKINKKTNSRLTVNIKDKKGVIIAKLLLNNMIPVVKEEAIIVDVKNSIYKDYYNAEIEYLRNKKVQNELIKKIDSIFCVINNKNDSRYEFFNKLCCDYNLLEEKCRKWKKTN